MLDDTTHQDRLQRNPPSGGLSGILQSKEPEGDGRLASCKAFGYHLGPEQVPTVEFRFRDGGSMWFPYGSLGPCRYHPSDGLLLKFSGDLIYLVLIHGSNLDRGIDGKAIDLIHAGLQRHHALWIKEMTQKEIQQVADAGPIIESIEVGGFETHEALKKWLEAKAPAFAKGPL